jgi:hypothetical protein
VLLMMLFAYGLKKTIRPPAPFARATPP